jgi:IS30 family transposase
MRQHEKAAARLRLRIARLHEQGLSNRQIAEKLCVHRNTVSNALRLYRVATGGLTARRIGSSPAARPASEPVRA